MNRNGETELTSTEATRILRKYWWIVPTAVVACGMLGLLLAMVLPKRYTSETLVLVDQPTVPADYVRPVVIEDLNRRLSSMQEEILSRSRLLPIIEKFDLFAQDRKRATAEDLVERLRKAVQVSPMESMPGTQNRGLTGFYVDVTFDDPQAAQRICTDITSMLMQQNSREREQQAVRTTSFLSEQLQEAKKKLDEQDAKLALFKRQYLGSLPEEEQTNLSLLTGMNAKLEANVQALSRAQQDKTFTESLLRQQEASAVAAVNSRSPETSEQQMRALTDQLASLRARYTPEHPDVVKLERQIDEFKRRIANAQEVAPSQLDSTNEPESPEIHQLRAKLRQDEMNIADLTKRQGHIQDQVRQLEERLQSSPVVEQRFKEITRNYQTALEFYNDLLKKQAQSAMATDLEHKQESERFRVLDPPSLPTKPSFPKKSYFAGGGAASGLGLAFVFLYLIALRDKSMYTQKDVELCLKIPVLAIVPTVQVIRSGDLSQG